MKLWSSDLGFRWRSLPLVDWKSIDPQGGGDSVSAHRRLASPQPKFLLSPIRRTAWLRYDFQDGIINIFLGKSIEHMALGIGRPYNLFVYNCIGGFPGSSKEHTLSAMTHKGKIFSWVLRANLLKCGTICQAFLHNAESRKETTTTIHYLSLCASR